MPANDIISRFLDKQTKNLVSLSRQIHADPEEGFEERNAVRRQLKLLDKWGFKVQIPFAGMETAYRAVAGKGKPVFAYTSEYDALPKLGHACGHNLICGASVGAAGALAETIRKEKIRGTVILLGTPGEEGKGGKVIMTRRKALKGIDAVMMAHPSDRTKADFGSSAVSRYDVTFSGKAAHAAAAPEKGRNALDAVMLLFQGINAWRQHLHETDRIHGIVTDGGDAPNIVPETASCSFYLRSLDDAILKTMIRRFSDIARGAGLMTGTKVEINPLDVPYKTLNPNNTLNKAFVKEATDLGMNPLAIGEPGRASTDFGDISHAVPGVHVRFGVSRKPLALHTIKFREAAMTDYAHSQMLKTAEAMARVGHHFLIDADFRKSTARDFRKRN